MTDREIQEFELALRQLGPRDQKLAELVKGHLAAGQTHDDVLTAAAGSRISGTGRRTGRNPIGRPSRTHSADIVCLMP